MSGRRTKFGTWAYMQESIILYCRRNTDRPFLTASALCALPRARAFFLQNGVVKLFDFGLARGFRASPAKGSSPLYHYTALVGSPRFMAPEVANGAPYNELCDVYSFSLLLWELLSLQKPYQHLSSASMRHRVWRPYLEEEEVPAERPRIHWSTWPLAIQDLLQKGWSPTQKVRPSMNTVTLVLGHVYSWMTNFCDEESKMELDASCCLTAQLLSPVFM